MAVALPSAGTRISHAGHLGTVRFVGPVEGTQGVWLGVEWDDPNRGKHDGVKDGRRYFTCLVPNSGSFIRPSSTISYGVSFLTALTAKYIDIPHGGSSSEKVILGSSGGAIEVEAVGLDKIRGKLAQLERLREVSLDSELVSTADAPGEIERTCPGIRGLDLSKNLIPGWDVVADIAIELSDLRRLSLNQNRLRLSQRSNISAFKRLEELQLNATLTTWEDLQAILLYMPSLNSVELGYNCLRSLQRESGTGVTHRNSHNNSTITSINLDSNKLEDFAELCAALHILPSLERLVLTSNSIARVPTLSSDDGGTFQSDGDAGQSPVRGLKHLALALNQIASWSDIDALPHWCPRLESMTLAGNPLVEDPVHKTHARSFAISKVPTLKILDGATITPKERTDSELLYLSHISKQPLSDTEKRAVHPQWQALSSKHGIVEAPSRASAQHTQDTLSNRLINVRIHTAAAGGPPPHSLPSDAVEGYLRGCRADAALRVLSTMSVRTFRMKAMKAFKIPREKQGAMRLWMVLPDGHFVEMSEEYAGRDLSWWGVEEGTAFVLAEFES
ncbi:hypothetical protein C2E23DRAFT_806938 [Lenzites betulinus]|nr:hypothetical protein C2E23DRAFT_806938 [Lenzites betulinus]